MPPLAVQSLPDWLKAVVDPVNANLSPGGTWAMLAICGVLGAAGAYGLLRLVRRHGPLGGELSLESFMVGLPLAAAAILAAGLIVIARHGEPKVDSTETLTQHVMEMAVWQTLVAALGVIVLRYNPLDPKRNQPGRFTQFRPRQGALTALCWVLTVPVLQMLLLASIAASNLAGIASEPQGVLSRMLQHRDLAGLAGAYLMVSVAAPLAEEFAFRVVLYGGLRTLTGHAAALVLSVAAFVLVHRVTEPSQVYLIVPLTFLAVMLTLTYAHTKSLWQCVLFHSLYNTSALTIALLTS